MQPRDTARKEPQHSLSEQWKGHNKKLCLVSILYFLLSIFYLPFKCLTCGQCVVWFRNNAHCIQSGFLLLQKEAKTRQWKAVKNILKVNWIENKNISASLCQGEQLGIKYCTICAGQRISAASFIADKHPSKHFVCVPFCYLPGKIIFIY